MKRMASIGECMIELSGATADAGAGPAGEGQMRRGFGGDTLNVAVYARRALPADAGTVAYVTSLGEDPFSADMLAAWGDEGIDVGLVDRIPGRLPGLYVIVTDAQGERSFLYWRSASAARETFRADNAGRLLAALRDYDLVYFSGITLAILDGDGRARLLDVLREVRGRGGLVAFDGNYRPRLWHGPDEARFAVSAILPYVSIALPTYEDEADLYGDADAHATADRLHALGVGEVAVKQGPRPVLLSGPDGREEVAVPPVARIVDTTAAGDSFNGAYLAARLTGLPPRDAAVRGNATAGRVIGLRGAIIPREE